MILIIGIFMGMLAGGVAGFFFAIMKCGQRLDWEKEKAKRNSKIIEVIKLYQRLPYEGKSIEGYLLDKGYNKIAVYGNGVIGQYILRELKNSNINVEYVIDNLYSDFTCERVLTMQDELDPVDVIIVTPVLEYETIKTQLIEKGLVALSAEEIR